MIKQINNPLPRAIFLMGPTASGKTDLAIQLVEQYPCEIISVDSALVYKGLNIGSAKPNAEELTRAPHRLIDIRDPINSYSAADFRKDALLAMAEITAAGKIPLLVGGTMLYFKALFEGIAQMPESDLVMRAEIENEAKQFGWPHLHRQLADVDPQSAARIHPNHSQRIERALGLYRSTGVTMTEFHQRQSVAEPFAYDVCQLAIAPLNRAVLHQRIEKRFRQMLEQGFVNEVRALHGRGDLHLDLPSIRAVGYRQVWQYLDGLLDYDEMIERGIIATRQLAKRQFTWLRAWHDLHWLHTDAENRLLVSEQTLGIAEPFVGQHPLQLALNYLGW